MSSLTKRKIYSRIRNRNGGGKMNKSIEKFNQFLKKYQVEIKKEFFASFLSLNYESTTDEKVDKIARLEKENIILENFQKIFASLDQPTRVVFANYDILSDFLTRSDLTAKDSTKVLFSLVEKNLAIDLLEQETYLVDSDKINDYPFKTMTNEEAWELICNVGISDLQTQEDLPEEMQLKIEEIMHFVEKNSVNMSHFLEAHKKIKKHYLSKLITYDKSDIQIVLASLKELKVKENILQKVSFTLEQDFQKRTKSIQPISLNLDLPTSTSHYITDEEFKHLKKELATYYNVYENQILKDITSEERDHCLELMALLGRSDKEMRNFLLRSEFVVSLPKNPIQRFLVLYDKIRYYDSNFQIKEVEDNILFYLSDMFMADEEEYRWIKQEIQEELYRLDYLFPDNYKYELEQVKKKIKK